MIENWNRHIRERGDHLETDELRQEADDILARGPNAWNEIPKLEKTERERQIIEALNIALNEYLDFMGLDRLEFSESEIFIVDDVYYRNNYPDFNGHQAVSGNHSRIIIPRILNEHRFVTILAHEMVHGVSYRRTSAEFKINDNNLLEFRIADNYRSGFRFGRVNNRLEDLKLFQFLGLNEAMTEFIAYKVRRYYYRSQGEFGEKAEELADMGAYTLEFGILGRVLQKYKQLGNDEQELMVDIQRGYFLGDMRPLKKLQVIHPDIVKIFRDMKHSDINSLISTARVLGLVEYVEKLEEIAKTIKK